MSRRIPSLTVVVAMMATTALTASASAATVKGTVVHTSRHAHSFVVAGASGHLTAVHARRSPKVGRTVVVRARKLANGTFGATQVRAGARRTRARLRGVVTFVDRRHRSFVVSAPGVSLAVTDHRRSRAGAAADSMPPLGADVTVAGTIDDQGDIESDSVHQNGQDTGTTELEGHVLAVDAAAGTITLSADDDGDIAGGQIVVHLPDTFDITAFAVGDELELHVTLNPDGSATAVASAHNGDGREADSHHGDQGDGGGDHQSGDAQGGGSDQPDATDTPDVTDTPDALASTDTPDATDA